MIPIEDMTDATLAIKDTDEDDEDLVIKVKIVKRSDSLWRFACGDVLFVFLHELLVLCELPLVALLMF